jgi:tetratricopeptide (TPR) repeat protein
MANDKPTSPTGTAEHRRVAVERFERATQVIKQGNFDYGIQLLMTCCKLDPSSLLFRQTLRRTQKAKYDNNLRGSRLAFLTTIRVRARMKSAKRARDFAQVLEHGEEILTRNPWDLSAQMDMAEAADALGYSDMAVFMLDQARQKYPKNPTVNRALARLFEKRGNYAHAITLWQQVKEAVPGDVEAASKAKDLAASETIQRGQYEQSISGEKPSIKAAAGAAQKKDASGDRPIREAAPLIERLATNPTDATLYTQLATVYRKNNQYEKARETLEKGLAATGNAFAIQTELMEMDLAPLRMSLEAADERIRQRAKADPDEETEEPSLDELKKTRQKLLREINSREIELYRVRADRFPLEMSHRLELGTRLLRADQIDQAIAELQQARKDPKHIAKATLNLGYCFKRRKNWKLALRNFEEALTNTPETDENLRKEILFQIANGHAEAGEFAKAIEIGHELANLDFGYKQIGKLIDDWQERLQSA